MRLQLFGLFLAAAVSGCGSGRMAAPIPNAPAETTANVFPASAGRYIKHVVIIVQENRTFDNIFAGFPGADAHTYGYMHDGTKVNLQPIPFEQKYIDHYFKTGIMDWDSGKMDKFDSYTLPPTQSNIALILQAFSHDQLRPIPPFLTFV